MQLLSVAINEAQSHPSLFFLLQMEMLKRKGVDSCLCVTVNTPDEVSGLSSKMKLQGTGVSLLCAFG